MTTPRVKPTTRVCDITGKPVMAFIARGEGVTAYGDTSQEARKNWCRARMGLDAPAPVRKSSKVKSLKVAASTLVVIAWASALLFIALTLVGAR